MVCNATLAAWLAGSLTLNAIFLLLSFARWMMFHIRKAEAQQRDGSKKAPSE